MEAMPERRPATRAEARALAHPLRLRILRLCLDEALTNQELAARLGQQPATMLYHVRTLEKEGFLRREPERRGRRSAREMPYLSTRKSWTLELGSDAGGHLAMMDAARAELAEMGPEAVLAMSRLAPRLPAAELETLVERVGALIRDTVAVEDVDGEPIGMLIVVHRRA
jgi:DNA-binding transcriptional ArsR family regulator